MATTITQNILVTGGSGFIGSNLVDLLVAQGHEVFVIDDLSSGLEKNENKSANYFHFNLMDCVQDNRKIKAILTNHNIQTVYHLAANADISLSVSHPEKAYEINLMSSIALVNTCNSCNVERFFSLLLLLFMENLIIFLLIENTLLRQLAPTASRS